MMNNSQNQAPVDGRFAPTQNPQNPGGQSLSVPSSDLQKTANLLASPAGPRITSVGDSTFKAFSASEATAVAAAPVTPAVTDRENHTPVFIAGGLAIGVCLIAAWLMARKSSAKLIKKSGKTNG